MVENRKSKLAINIDFSEEVDATIAVCSVVIILLLTDYFRRQLDFNWQFFLTPILSLASALLLIHLKVIYKSVTELDYLKFCRRIAVSLLVSTTIVLIWHLPTTYQSFKYASYQPIITYKIPATYYRPKGRNFLYHASYNFNGLQRYLSLTKSEARAMEEGQNRGLSYCLILSVQKGLNESFVLRSYEVETCN